MAEVSLDDLSALIMARRTNLHVDLDRDVPPGLVEQLCALATWAPNHKRTWPWRFALFVADARARLGEAFAADMVEAGIDDAQKLAKVRTKYLRAPAQLVIGSATHTKPALHLENMLAVAAGIQNLLLGATAAGLASYWSSPPLTEPRRVLDLCGFDADVQLVGTVYLGYPSAAAPVPQRPLTPLKVVHR